VAKIAREPRGSRAPSPPRTAPRSSSRRDATARYRPARPRAGPSASETRGHTAETTMGTAPEAADGTRPRGGRSAGPIAVKGLAGPLLSCTTPRRVRRGGHPSAPDATLSPPSPGALVADGMAAPRRRPHRSPARRSPRPLAADVRLCANTIASWLLALADPPPPPPLPRPTPPAPRRRRWQRPPPPPVGRAVERRAAGSRS